MGLFKHEDDEAKAAAAAAELANHPEPVTIDLGTQKAFDVQMVVSELIEEGLTLYLLDAGDLGDTTPLYPAECRVLVKAEEADQARAAFVDAGFLDA
jgi:alpha/beta superfamily hydrolase